MQASIISTICISWICVFSISMFLFVKTGRIDRMARKMYLDFNEMISFETIKKIVYAVSTAVTFIFAPFVGLISLIDLFKGGDD